MSMKSAEGALTEHGAQAVRYQVVTTEQERKKGTRLHFYRLPSGDVLEIHSRPGSGGRTVYKMLISTYNPTSWNNKLDPERLKFFASFVSVKAYELK